MVSLASLRVRLRRSSLGAKLSGLGAAVTAAVVLVTFWGLSVEARRNSERVFTGQLERNQRALHQLQDRSAREMLMTARLISRAPSFQYSLKTFQLETARGGEPSPALAREIQDQLSQLAREAGADVLSATDDSGRVFASAGVHAAAVPRGTALGALGAMQRALAPDLPADSGSLAVLRAGGGYFHMAVYPLVQDGFTIGALVLGEPLDSVFGRARAASDADVLLTAGPTAVAYSDSLLASPRIIATLAGLADSPRARTVRLGDEDFVVTSLALGDTQAREPVRLWMLQPLSRRVSALMRPLRRDFIVYGVIAVLVAAVGATLVARSVLGPFTRFVAYMRSGAAAEERQGRFDADHEAAEVRTLNASFNQLMDSLGVKRQALEVRTAELAAANVVLTDEIGERARVEAALRESEAQLRQSQKLEAIGTLAGGVAHDFNNLITVISGYAQLALMRAEATSQDADDLRQVIEASDRAAGLTHQLLAFSRKQVLQPTVLDLAEVVSGISPMLRRIIGEHIHLVVESGTALARVRADRGQLEQVLLNLAVNARDAMPSGGRLTIATANEDTAMRPVAGVSLIVRDTGTGMSEEVKERIFEPFFTTKDVGQGTGLGLSMVYGIVNQSGGTIAVDSVVGRGTAFTITLPALGEEEAGASGAPVEDISPRGHETILIVEDADALRTLARRTLEEHGYAVRVARNAAEALEVAAAGPVDVLLTDVVMPETSGPELVAEYRARWPAPVVIYMSGYAHEVLERYHIDPGAVFLQKPFTPVGLARTVRRALDAQSPSGLGGAGGGVQREVASHAAD